MSANENGEKLTKEEKQAATIMGLTFSEFKQVKDAVLSVKQGEALERSSRPNDLTEALALGDFGADTNMSLNMIASNEETINKLSHREEKSDTMTRLAKLIAVASASRKGKRLDGVLEAVGRLGGAKSFTQKDLPAPVHLNATEPG